MDEVTENGINIRVSKYNLLFYGHHLFIHTLIQQDITLFSGFIDKETEM